MLVFGLRREERGGSVVLEVGADMRSSDGGGGGGFVLEIVEGGAPPATLPRRCSIKAFCFCLTEIIDLTCSIALGLSGLIVKPMTAGEIGVEFVWSTTGLTSVLSGCGAPLTVTLRFFMGEGV